MNRDREIWAVAKLLLADLGLTGVLMHCTERRVALVADPAGTARW